MSLVSSTSRSFLPTLSKTTCALCDVGQKRFAHKLVEVELLSDIPSLGSRGQRLPVSRGHARYLGSRNQALFVINNKASSPLRDLLAKESRREEEMRRFLGMKQALEQQKKTKQRSVQSAKSVLDEILDPRQVALEREQALFASLQQVQSLKFERLTTNATSPDLFGSVSISDLINEFKTLGIRLDDSATATTVNFESTDGIEKNRIKKVGTFDCVVSLKELEKEVRIPVIVQRAAESNKE